MFVDAPADDELLQGDICHLPAVPVWDFDLTAVVAPPESAPQHLQLPVHTKAVKWDEGSSSLVMVLSHSCDIENPRGRTGLVVAPLLRVPASASADATRYSQIIRSHTPTDGAFDYLNLFPIEFPPGGWSVVDFSSLTSMAKASRAKEELLRGKVAQIADDFREKLQDKMAVWLASPSRARQSAAT